MSFIVKQSNYAVLRSFVKLQIEMHQPNPAVSPAAVSVAAVSLAALRQRGRERQREAERGTVPERASVGTHQTAIETISRIFITTGVARNNFHLPSWFLYSGMHLSSTGTSSVD